MVLAFMAGEREHILRNGKIIHLRTAPIDPQDMFRGDYVRLNYEISRIPISKLIDTSGTRKLNKGDKLYVVLKEGPNGLYELVDVSTHKPDDGVYIKGRIPHKYQTLRAGSPIWVNYGIEAYFVQQGKGREMERRRGRRNEIQIPLEMEIAISHGGKAVIRGYRWSPLGIGLKILRSPPRNPQTEDDLRSATVRLTLANASNAPLAIVDLPNYCSFSLKAVPWAKKNWIPVYNSCKSLLPDNTDVVILLPQQEKSFDIHFSDERWLVKDNDVIKEIGVLDWSERFRIVYRPPNESACQQLEKRESIWHGYLPSRVFHGRGRID
jgi:uncharacterized membrane-anchored protein